MALLIGGRITDCTVFVRLSIPCLLIRNEKLSNVIKLTRILAMSDVTGGTSVSSKGHLHLTFDPLALPLQIFIHQ